VGLTDERVVVWSQGFEDASWEDNWRVEGASWEVGELTSGPNTPHDGSRCAATVLAGNQPPSANSYLIRGPFTVPPAGDNPRLRLVCEMPPAE
jgi:hypothetical protein